MKKLQRAVTSIAGLQIRDRAGRAMRTPTLYTFLCDLGLALIIFHVAPLLIAQARVPLDLSRTHLRQPTAACEHHQAHGGAARAADESHVGGRTYAAPGKTDW